MDLITGESNTVSAPAIKEPGSFQVPELRLISEADFQNFTYTGISIDVPTPIVKISGEAMFGINIDGFIPSLTFNNKHSIYKNLFPVQVTSASHTVAGLSVNFEYAALPAMVNYLSHRFIEGDIGVALRITSNTAQSGNFIVSQLSGAARYYYAMAETYTGLRFLNDSVAPIDYAPNGFATIDLSLNRHVAITPCRRDNMLRTDFSKKLRTILDFPVTRNSNTYFPFQQQFLEDWLIFAPLTNIPHPEASSVNIAIYYDWSRVKFYTPMLPFIPIYPNNVTMQILRFSKTFNGAVGYADYTAWNWLPKDAASLEIFEHKGSGILSAEVKLEDNLIATLFSSMHKYFTSAKKLAANQVRVSNVTTNNG